MNDLLWFCGKEEYKIRAFLEKKLQGCTKTMNTSLAEQSSSVDVNDPWASGNLEQDYSDLFERSSGGKSGLYELQKLRSIHENILRMDLLGMTGLEIAKALGITSQVVYYTLNSQIGKERRAELQGRANSRALTIATELAKLGPKAITALESALDDPDAAQADRIRAAIGILDRSGHAPIKKVQGSVHHSTEFTAEDLANIREIAKNARQEIEYITIDVHESDSEDCASIEGEI